MYYQFSFQSVKVWKTEQRGGSAVSLWQQSVSGCWNHVSTDLHLDHKRIQMLLHVTPCGRGMVLCVVGQSSSQVKYFPQQNCNTSLRNGYIYIALLSIALHKVFAALSPIHAHTHTPMAVSYDARSWPTIGNNLSFSVLSRACSQEEVGTELLTLCSEDNPL